jgi:uncharacterized protein (TIGR03083 family)
MHRAEIGVAIATERERLVRDLRGVATSAWDEPSLCEGWRVRDVVGHLIRNDESFRRGYPLIVDLARAGFRPQRALADAARRKAATMSPAELLDALWTTRYESRLRFHPAPQVPLGELLIHGQDIRRALELAHDVPPDHFVVAADGALTFVRTAFRWGSAPRVRFVATDTDWSHGSGEDVRGPIEAITMVLAGRTVAAKDLEGSEHLRA